MNGTDTPARSARRLSNQTLADSASGAGAARYDRGSLTPGVVHIGVGGFHRAHQAVYFDELAERGVTDWGVVGVGLHSRSMKEALEPQDLLYTVLERGQSGDALRVVGSLHAYLYAPDDPEAVFAALADERIRLVTLTVTGAGYHVEPATWALDASADAVQADLGRRDRPTTFLGYLVEGLDRRRRAGARPFTVLSCDNVPENGKVARAAIVSFARLFDPALADWIDEHVAFPSSMVDRITPGTTDDDSDVLEREFGVGDNWPVVTEQFRQWIVEDEFCNERPPLEDVGVHFVEDVAPYELMKKRLLNGTHCAVAYLGYLAGHRTADETMADPVFHAFASRLMDEEVAPLLPAVPGIDLEDYTRTLLRRFANPRMKDDLQRLARRGSTKVPAYLLPSIAEARAADRRHDLLMLAVAGWVRYLRGVDLQGAEIAVQDERKDQLQPLARAGGDDPGALLAERTVFGELAGDPDFVARLGAALSLIERHGPRGAIEAALTPAEAVAA
jgi:mannitol 2-dehydrogenase